MKYCLQCASKYSDDLMTYCLLDGSRLIQNDPSANTVTEPEATCIFPEIESFSNEMIRENDWGLCEITYPQVKGIVNPYIQSRINTFFKNEFGKYIVESG